MTFKDKTVWITGASSGIGESLAYELAKAGARLILSARNEAELQRVKEACLASESHTIVPIDLEKYHLLETTANKVWEEHGPIDVLICNAGVSQRYLVVESKLDLDEKIMDTNFWGTIALTRPILKKMLERQSGHLAVTSSMLGLYGVQTRAAYSASKHALRGYFESLRNELFKTKIKITLIYPGYINTKISKNALVADGRSYGQSDALHIKGIAPQLCAQKIIYAIEHEKPQLIVAGPKERFGLVMARFFPAIFRHFSSRLDI
ncbi:Putative oxidoreductase SadH [Legionella massiliensis]|uniref:Putative oxidoreductase SadH n=2 Tax=Legionella massiliensis TaxID=1034943 RepID=A0A078L3M6_9GAMM|nr:Putative oxidoreductase SadH [Legionella massiliensis]CEE14462.1 Putative oxidoreductase SadH [Legionella massiliensis]